ncbi:MAG: hypothetical protein Q4P08_06615 [Eubacteriales bacterium]|nr:hypothetical protein [Eubacteriales bacterium]
MRKYLKLLVILSFILLLSSCEPLAEEELGQDSNFRDLKAMVRVNGKVYGDLSFVNSAIKCDVPDGEIKTSVDRSQIPEKDDESNFGVGYEYQYSSEGYLTVKIKDRWYIFQTLEIDNGPIPEMVANFKAKVVDSEADRLLVELLEVPRSFRYCFANKGASELKVISLPIDNLDLAGAGGVKISELREKTVEVYFDGLVNNLDDELSSPIELGQVYRISIIKE